MIWFLYNILFHIGFLILVPHFLLRMRRRGGYRKHFTERFGRYSPDVQRALAEGGRTWIHAVSVGEIFVALSFIEEMRRQQPGRRFVLSTNTSTARRIAEEKIDPRDVLIYFPIDLYCIVRRVLCLMRPACLVLVECELWPNLVRYSFAQGIPIHLINGRVSEHSYKGYRRLRLFTRRLLPLIETLMMQSQADANRMLDLGAPADAIRVMGSAKYQTAARSAAGEVLADELLKRAGFGPDDPILLGGSTWPGEEEALAQAVVELKIDHPKLRMILCPRHFERCGEVETVLEQAKLTWVRRTQLDRADESLDVDVLLVDSTGELMNFYHAADIIFIGKSLTANGGQNFIEPALCGIPVVVGPNLQNFPVVAEDFIEAKAFEQLAGPDELLPALRTLLNDTAYATELGHRGQTLVEAHSGVMTETVKVLLQS